MADLDAAIREGLDDIAGSLRDDFQGIANLDGLYALKPIAALQAVLYRHRPDLHGDCAECVGRDQNPVPWPCVTVADIARELGVTQAGQP